MSSWEKIPISFIEFAFLSHDAFASTNLRDVYRALSVVMVFHMILAPSKDLILKKQQKYSTEFMTAEFTAVFLPPVIQRELTACSHYLLQITLKPSILKQQTLAPSFLIGQEYG